MTEAQLIKDLLYRLADDKLIIGHRNSEWCGMGPVLEEDIAFASMAQDELGHAWSYYRILEELGEGHPDQVAFNRTPKEFTSCHLVEYPIGDYAFSLMRHFLFDYADRIRLKYLQQCDYTPLRDLSAKIAREEKYHQLHGKTWVTQLAKGTEEARLRMQTALNEAYPMAFGMFEPGEHDQAISNAGLMPEEEEVCEEWQTAIEPVLVNAGLQIPENPEIAPHLGGRKGYHSEHLAPLLSEMTEVFQIDPTAQW